MIFGAIANKTELWLPSHVYSQGTFSHCDPEDYFTPHGFALPVTNSTLSLAESLTSEHAYCTAEQLFLLTKDEKVKVVVRSHNRNATVEIIKLKDTHRLFVGRGNTVNHTAAIATELFRTGHFKDVESFLKVHRKSFLTNVKYVKYDMADILERLPEPISIIDIIQGESTQIPRMDRFYKK